MKKFLFLMLIPTMVAAQQTINGLNIKGKLDVISTTKSSNPCPSMTEAQRDLIIVPAIGSCVYNTKTLSLNIYDGAEWKSAGGGGISLWLTLTGYKTDDVVIDSNKIYKSLSDHTSGVFATDLANGDWVELSASEIVDLTTDVTGVLPVANGGTGTSIKNFVDLASSQSVGGNKSFQNGVAVQGDLLTYGAVQTTLSEGMVSTNAAGNLIKGVLRPEIDLENQRLGFNYGGNDNLIPNGSFENTVAEDNWNCSSGVGTVGESNVSVADGVKSLKVGLGTGASYCYQDNIVIPSANVGKEHIYSITASSDRMLDFCAVGSSLDQSCVRYTPGNGPQLLTTFYTPTTTTGNGLIIKSVNLLAGDMYIDKASMKVVTPSENSKSISNLNSLTDPSFEKGLVDGWQLSGVGSLTASATEVLDLPRNKKALMVDSSTTTNVLTASWSTAIPPAGVSGVCSGWVKTPNTLTAEVASNSTRIAFKAIEGTNVWQYFEMYFKTDGTHTPTCRFLNATATIYHLDEMFFGLKESPINITSFKNETGRIRLGNASSMITGETTNPTFGTTTENAVYVTREGSFAYVEYVLNQTTAGTAGSGIYRYALPVVDGVQLKFKADEIDYSYKGGGHAGISASQAGVLYFLSADIRPRTETSFMVQGYSANNNSGTISTTLNAHNSGNFPASSTSLKISIALKIYVPEWSENTNGALITCKEGPLKCANEYTFTRSSTGAIDNVLPAGWITCGAISAGASTCTINSGVGLTVPMSCIPGFSTTSTAQVDSSTTQIYSISTSGLSVNTYTGAGASSARRVTVNCTKQGSNYNAGYEKVLGFTEDADIRSTEWLTGGYDYISNKPIYKRCHRVVSDFSSGTLVTWPANLNPVNTLGFKAGGNRWMLMYHFWSTGDYLGVEYVKSTGVVTVGSVGNALSAGTTLCMDYVK